MKLPPPGSGAAIAQGCKCPRMDNAHGHGYMGQQGIYIYNAGCHLHVIGTEVDITADPNDDSDIDESLNSFNRNSCDASDECESCQ